jgi:hypothetical protein
MNETAKNGLGHQDDDLEQARRDVTRAERALSHRLHEATELGGATLRRAVSVTRPVLIGVAVVGGVVWLVSMLRRGRRQSRWTPPSQRSLLAEATRAAALSIASIAARRFAEHYLGAPEATQSISPGRAGAPQRAVHSR